MNREMIYLIRENKDLYQYLKYNSYLYKNILRNEISIKELEKLMTYINQPINSKLSSLLQVLCATTTNPKMVEYLLKQGANPYYMDINGKTAYDYALENKFHLKDWFFILLNQYQGHFKPISASERQSFVFSIIQSEIIKHEILKIEAQEQLLKDLDDLEAKELPYDE
jgi:hypothetical protein